MADSAYRQSNTDWDSMRSFVNPYDGKTYYDDGTAGAYWRTQQGTKLSDPENPSAPMGWQQGDALAERLQREYFEKYPSGGQGLTAAQMANMTNNRLSQEQLERSAAEKEYGDLEQEYTVIPERLRELYSAAAKKGGTYSDTGEFKAGLDSEVGQGTRGAQAILQQRLSALRSKLGMPAQAGDNPGSGLMTASNKVGDSTTSAPASSDSSAPATSDAPQTATSSTTAADSQNAVSKATLKATAIKQATGY